MIPIHAVADAWNRFFHAPEAPYTLALFRVLFGGLLLANAALFARDARLWIGRSGLLSHRSYREIYGDSRFTLLRFLPATDRSVHAIVALHLLGAGLLTIGLATRWSALLTFVTLISIQHRNPVLVYGADDLMRFMSFLLIFSHAGDALSVDRWLGARSGVVPQSGTAWCTRVMQLQLSIVYAGAFLNKFSGVSWVNGTAGFYAVQVSDYRRRPLPAFARTMFWARFGTWTVMGVEGLLGPGLWIRELRYPLLMAGIAMHVMMDWFMNLQLFGATMIVCLLLFVDPADMERALRAIGLVG